MTSSVRDASAEKDCPAEYRLRSGLLEVRHEEDALCWFWAIPNLLPWPTPVHWLYTPVVGNSRWPGDLWGVDANGEILILECKQCRHRDDPFHDFVAYHRPGREEFEADHWLKKWDFHRKQELNFSSAIIERPQGQTGGMLPRSNRRAHIRRWPGLATVIDAHIRSATYIDSVRSALAKRQQRSNPPPHYCALIVVSDESPILTKLGFSSGRQLVTLVDPSRVHVVRTQGSVQPSGRVRLSATRESFRLTANQV